MDKDVLVLDSQQDSPALEKSLADKGYRLKRFSSSEELESFVDAKADNSVNDLSTFQIDKASLELQYKKERVRFTPREFSIFLPLFESFGSFIKRDNLSTSDSEQKSRSLDVHVASIRKKIKVFGLDIETLRGIGYRLSQVS